MPSPSPVEWFSMDDEQWDFFMDNLKRGSIINVVDVAHELTGESKSECRRLIKGGAFKWNNIRLDDTDIYVDLKSGRFYRVNMEDLLQLTKEQND